MNMWAIIGIIVIVLGIIVGNIMLLKYSAKFKMPKIHTPSESSDKVTDAEPESAPAVEQPGAPPANNNADPAPTTKRADD